MSKGKFEFTNGVESREDFVIIDIPAMGIPRTPIANSSLLKFLGFLGGKVSQWVG
jgi:hypothetical protein